MSIIYLNSLGTYGWIIVCYSSLTAIATFDNMFSVSLEGHPIKEVIGDKLAVTYHRYMKFELPN